MREEGRNKAQSTWASGLKYFGYNVVQDSDLLSFRVQASVLSMTWGWGRTQGYHVEPSGFPLFGKDNESLVKNQEARALQTEEVDAQGKKAKKFQRIALTYSALNQLSH